MSATIRLYAGDEAAAPSPMARLPHAPTQDPRLNDKAVRVLLALTNWAWGERPDCWPTNGQIARFIQCSTRTVQRALDQLEQAGYITRRMVSHGGGWRRMIRLAWRTQAVSIHLADRPVAPDAPVTPPAHAVSPPPVTDASHKVLKRGEEKKLIPATPTQPLEGALSSREAKGSGQEADAEAEQPPTPEERDRYRALLASPPGDGPKWRRHFAWKMLSRYDAEWLAGQGLAKPPDPGAQKIASGPSDKVPRRDSVHQFVPDLSNRT